MANEHAYVRYIGDIGGRGSHEVDCFIRRVEYAWTPINTFNNALNAHTDCNRGAIVRTTVTSLAGSAPGTSVNVDKRAIIYFRDPSDLKVYQFSYPAPIAADLETKPSGIRIKDSVVTTIVGYISTLNSISYVPLYGLYYQKV